MKKLGPKICLEDLQPVLPVKIVGPPKMVVSRWCPLEPKEKGVSWVSSSKGSHTQNELSNPPDQFAQPETSSRRVGGVGGVNSHSGFLTFKDARNARPESFNRSTGRDASCDHCGWPRSISSSQAQCRFAPTELQPGYSFLFK